MGERFRAEHPKCWTPSGPPGGSSSPVQGDTGPPAWAGSVAVVWLSSPQLQQLLMQQDDTGFDLLRWCISINFFSPFSIMSCLHSGACCSALPPSTQHPGFGGHFPWRKDPQPNLGYCTIILQRGRCACPTQEPGRPQAPASHPCSHSGCGIAGANPPGVLSMGGCTAGG